MSFYHGRRLLPQRFRLVLLSVLQAVGLPFADALSEEEIENPSMKRVSRSRKKTTMSIRRQLRCGLFSLKYCTRRRTAPVWLRCHVSLCCWRLWDATCARRTAAPTVRHAPNYLKWSVVIERLTLEVAHRCEKAVSRDWLWHGHHVKLVDGTTVSMPDTEENQEEYPQQASQKEGLGFPIARLVVLVSLATAMICGMAIGPYSGKEKRDR